MAIPDPGQVGAILDYIGPTISQHPAYAEILKARATMMNAVNIVITTLPNQTFTGVAASGWNVDGDQGRFFLRITGLDPHTFQPMRGDMAGAAVAEVTVISTLRPEGDNATE